MSGKIVYRFETPKYPGNILYVNLIANYSCTNDCLFCSSPKNKEDVGKPNIYEKKAGSNLFLEKSPSVDEIMDSIDNEIDKADSELAIIGLGEPLIYFPKVLDVIKKVKSKYDIKTRIDTNGLVNCMYEQASKKLEEAGLDEIRISLNAINPKEYDALCKPKFKDAYQNLVQFVNECNDSSIDTKVSFVTNFRSENISSRPKEEYINYAKSLGINENNIILRDYVKPI